MAYPVLQSIIRHSTDNGLHLNIIYGNDELPTKYKNLLKKTNHIKYLPYSISKQFNEGIIILNKMDVNFIAKDKKAYFENMILRVAKADLSELSGAFKSLEGKFKRLNLFLLDIETYTQPDLELYERQLNEILLVIQKEYKQSNSIELNFVSDRLILNSMNNCNAGISHITVAPNGKFYICPGFYYNDESNNIGSVKTGMDIKNQQLLYLENAPICKYCDAFQCKRCLYLNKKTTNEINTPSHEQCVLSHIERNASLSLLKSLNIENSVSNKINIPELDYLDPFELAQKNKREIRISGKSAMFDFDNKSTENMTDRELLIRILKIQQEIIRHFNIKF